MEYTIQKLAKLAGVSTRTLRYYDEIGLLKPARINSSGYRIYGQKEVNTLQQIMFYRELGVGLAEIKEIITNPHFDPEQALKSHREKLLARRKQIDTLIANVEKTLAHIKGGKEMSDQEKFTGFKKKLIEENEEKYGKEARERWGDETVDASNAKFMNMTREQYEEHTQLTEKLNETLKKAMEIGDPASEVAQKAAALHKEWLLFFWTEYSIEAHAGLATMYVEDERFKAYYDNIQPGAAEFLRDAIHIYTGVKN